MACTTPSQNLIPLRIRVLDQTLDPISYATEGSSGFDVRSSVSGCLKPHSFFMFPCGIILELEKGWEAQVRSRSGLAAKHGISVLNSPGTIDSDYRGEIKVILYNHGSEDFIVERNMRIAQIVLSPVVQAHFVWENKDLSQSENAQTQISQTSRGEGGFGSTGLY